MNDTNNISNHNAADFQEEKGIDLTIYIKALWQNKWKIVSFAVGVTILAFFVIIRLQPVYQSKATLFITKDTSAPVTMSDAFSMDMQAREYLETQFNILRSESLAQDVINNLDLTNEKLLNEQFSRSSVSNMLSFLKPSKDARKPLSDSEMKRQNIVDWIDDNLSIKPIERTQLVEIRFESTNPELAANIVNSLGEAYITSFLDAKMLQTDRAIDWLQTRKDNVSAELASAQKALQAYRAQENIVEFKAGMQSLNEETLRSINERLLEIQNERVKLQNIISQPDGSAAMSGLIEESQLIQQLNNAEIEAERKFVELSQRYGPKHPKYITAAQELNNIRSRLEKQVNVSISEIKEKLSNLISTETSLKKQLKDVESQFVSNSSKEAEYESLKGDVQRLTELNELITRRFKEVDMSSDFSAENARFIDKAKIPFEPIKPKKALLVIAAFVGSIGFASALVVLLTFLKNTFRSAEEVEEELKARLLGIVPSVKHAKSEDLALHIYYDESQRQFIECIKTIRTSFLLGSLNKTSAITLVTSAVPGEGKSTNAVNLAFSFSNMEDVLLIDADLRKPSLAKRFGLPSYQTGLSEILLGSAQLEDCLVKDEKSNITLLPAGHHTHSALELFSNGKLETLLSELSKRYSKIIIDSAPCQAVSDSLVLAKFVDSVILVVRADATKKDLVKNAAKRIRQTGITIDGVILNAADVNSDKQNYQGYYDYYGYAE